MTSGESLLLLPGFGLPGFFLINSPVGRAVATP
jgi:hypothetical protein